MPISTDPRLLSRLLQISKDHDLSHLGSNFTAIDIIDFIFRTKRPDEHFVLSAGHAGLALYCVMEKHGRADAEELLNTCGIHPDASHSAIKVSTGSLGQGLPIALGLALANRSKNVYVLMSDGECFEGTTWEAGNAMRRFNVTNLKVFVNYNGWSAYERVDDDFMQRVQAIIPNVTIVRTNNSKYSLPDDLSAHYIKIGQWQ